ncbi:MAG: hypothetical protein R3F21_13345 [Myxococcota bacterium]
MDTAIATLIANGQAPKPHDGCSKFDTRFGNDALRFVQARATRDQNRRGIYWRVVEPGEVAVGDSIRVVSRGARGAEGALRPR